MKMTAEILNASVPSTTDGPGAVARKGNVVGSVVTALALDVGVVAAIQGMKVATIAKIR